VGEHPSASPANSKGWHALPRADERPVMQGLQHTLTSSEPLTDMSQFPGDKAGPSRAELKEIQADSAAMS
jgi:hypothetical protein